MLRVTALDQEALPLPALDSTTQPKARVRRLAAEPLDTHVEAIIRPLVDATSRVGQGPQCARRANALARILAMVAVVIVYSWRGRSTCVP